MQIQIQTIPFEVDDTTLENITKKLKKLTQFYERIEKCNVILKEEKNDIKKNFFAEVRIAIPKHDLFASDRAESFGKAIDMVVEDLKKQLIKSKQNLNQVTGMPDTLLSE